MSPRTNSSSERIAQIHEAALSLFAQKGYHETTMDDIVEATGLSKGTLYWYFQGKQDLFISLFRDAMAQLAASWGDAVVDEDADAQARLRASLEFFRSHAEEMSVVFGILTEAWALSRGDEDTRKALMLVLGRAQGILEELLDRGVASGEFDVQATGETGVVLLSLVAGLILSMGGGIWGYRWDQVIDALEPLLLHGLRGQGGGART